MSQYLINLFSGQFYFSDLLLISSKNATDDNVTDDNATDDNMANL